MCLQQWRFQPPIWPLMPTLSLLECMLGPKIKRHILRAPNWAIILPSQCTCNWSIKLPRKIGSFTQVNTEILIITVQRWKGQVLIPILETRKWRNRGEMTCPNSQWGGATARNRNVSASRPGLLLFCFSLYCGTDF